MYLANNLKKGNLNQQLFHEFESTKPNSIKEVHLCLINSVFVFFNQWFLAINLMSLESQFISP